MFSNRSNLARNFGISSLFTSKTGAASRPLIKSSRKTAFGTPDNSRTKYSPYRLSKIDSSSFTSTPGTRAEICSAISSVSAVYGASLRAEISASTEVLGIFVIVATAAMSSVGIWNGIWPLNISPKPSPCQPGPGACHASIHDMAYAFTPEPHATYRSVDRTSNACQRCPSQRRRIAPHQSLSDC